MTSFYEELLDAIADKDLTRASELVRSGLDLDVPCDEGASALYPAILTGDVSLVRLMLEFALRLPSLLWRRLMGRPPFQR